MSMKHTLGPWVVDQHKNVMAAGGLVAFPGVAAVFDQEANARLIAAAPELLEAAQAAWNCIAELPPTQARAEVVQLLRAAIEKAAGEQP